MEAVAAVGQPVGQVALVLKEEAEAVVEILVEEVLVVEVKAQRLELVGWVDLAAAAVLQASLLQAVVKLALQEMVEQVDLEEEEARVELHLPTPVQADPQEMEDWVDLEQEEEAAVAAAVPIIPELSLQVLEREVFLVEEPVVLEP